MVEIDKKKKFGNIWTYFSRYLEQLRHYHPIRYLEWLESEVFDISIVRKKYTYIRIAKKYESLFENIINKPDKLKLSIEDEKLIMELK